MIRLLIILLLLAMPLKAQDVASLIADDVSLVGTTGITAEGNVVIYYDGVQLEAQRIIYDRPSNRLVIDGPIRLTDGDQILMLANSAELDSKLRNGVLISARMVLEQQLQLAAAEIRVIGGRYTQLYKTVASSCHICDENPIPLWQIRAERVVHDREEQQLYFDNAQLRVMDVPVLWLPRLRLPDPTLERATGFLIPSIRSTSRLGFGVKIPYFIRLGDHRDLTITPYLSTSTGTLELRYRQAFRTGDLTVEGAISADDLVSQTRGYVFANGHFYLPRDYELDFDLEVTSDDGYLLDYGYSGKDRLDSSVAVTRTRHDEYIGAELTYIKSLRPTEDNDLIPSIIADFAYHRRFEPRSLGGVADLRFEGHAHYRRSSMAGDDGRDVGRLSAGLDWRRDHVFGNGMVGAVLAGFDLDYYATRQAAPTDEEGFFHTAGVGLELRWPHSRVGPNGAVHVIEPVAQIFFTDESPRGVANEDSTLLEFDEGNLFSDSRFSGADVYERGLRANLGMSWTRHDPAGWSFGVTVGRIFRDGDLSQFTAGSGLTGSSSDWLLSGQLDLENGLSLLNRSLFDDFLRFTRNETRLSWHTNRLELATTYLWMDPAPAESRPETSEWSFDARYALNDQWTASTDWRYDFIADRAARIGLGLEFSNECVTVDLSVSRRFTSSTSVKPTTDFGLSVSLTGFGANTSGGVRAHRCNG